MHALVAGGLFTNFTRLGALLLVALMFNSGCSSTAKRTALVGGGTAAGAGIGYALAPEGDEALGTAVGAVGGALLTSLAIGEDKELAQRKLDEGYMLGSADSVKRLYWAKQDIERQKAAVAASASDIYGAAGGGSVRYYVWEDDGLASDGRKLAPERVAVPIYEPHRTLPEAP